MKAPLFSVWFFESRTVSEFFAECPTANHFTANGNFFSDKNRPNIYVKFSRLFQKYRLRVTNNWRGMSVDSPSNTLNNALKSVRQWCYYDAVLLARLRFSHALYNHRIKWVTDRRLLGVTIETNFHGLNISEVKKRFFFQKIKSHWPEISRIIISYFTFFNLKYSAQKSTPNRSFLYGETSRWTFMVDGLLHVYFLW